MAAPHPTSGKFSFSSVGLLYESEPRSTQAAILRRLLSPDQVTVKWLKSQLAHYAIKPLSGTKEELEARLKEAVKEGKVKLQPKEMREMEKGLKTAFEARGMGGKKAPVGRVEKKSGAGAKKTPVPEKAYAKKTAVPEKPTAAQKKKGAALLAAANLIIAQNKERSKPKKPAPAVKKPAPVVKKPAPVVKKKSTPPPPPPPKQRISFADRLVGTYTLNYPGSSTLQLYRESQDLTGRLVLCGSTARISLDWVPMAKQSRVPFSCDSGEGGEMEFRVVKGGVKVKGKIEGVEWEGVKREDGEWFGDGDMGEEMELDGYW